MLGKGKTLLHDNKCFFAFLCFYNHIGNGAYLVSGDYKNTTELRCFEQSILSLNRIFVGSTKEKNSISFEYKVDGAACRRGSLVCSHGLHVFLNGKKKLQADLQFQWKTKTINNINPVSFQAIREDEK